MDMQASNWWWIMGGLFVAAFVAQQSTLIAALLLASGAYLALRAGYQGWGGDFFRPRKVKETYWRGRRIELPRNKTTGQRLPELPPLSTALYLILGSALALGALALVLDGLAGR